MWLLRFHWPITIGQCLGEGTRSRLRLTGEPREWYARIPENEPLIWPKGGIRVAGSFSETQRPRFGDRDLSDNLVLAQNDRKL
jgi:hypothetical protein